MNTIKLTDYQGRVLYYNNENASITIQGARSPSWYEEVVVHIVKREKVLAIKAYQAHTGCSLRGSKEAIDQLEQTLVSIEEKYVEQVEKTIKLEDLL